MGPSHQFYTVEAFENFRKKIPLQKNRTHNTQIGPVQFWFLTIFIGLPMMGDVRRTFHSTTYNNIKYTVNAILFDIFMFWTIECKEEQKNHLPKLLLVRVVVVFMDTFRGQVNFEFYLFLIYLFFTFEKSRFLTLKMPPKSFPIC